MNWQEKMKLVVESVLNGGRMIQNVFTLTIIDEYSLLVQFDGIDYIKETNVNKLENHWRETARKIIHTAIEQKINFYLSKY